jgi:hypothetical protein
MRQGQSWEVSLLLSFLRFRNQIFLTLGASPFACNREGWCPVMRAIFRDCTQVLSLLLDPAKKKADAQDPLLASIALPPETCDEEDRLPSMELTPLQLAARLGYLEACKIILHMGGNHLVNACNNQGWTAFHIAVAFNQVRSSCQRLFLEPAALLFASCRLFFFPLLSIHCFPSVWWPRFSVLTGGCRFLWFSTSSVMARWLTSPPPTFKSPRCISLLSAETITRLERTRTSRN